MSVRRATFSDGEESWGTRSRAVTEGDFDVTPMIDVTFQLLIFFMLCSTMQGAKEFEMPQAEFALGIEEANATIVLVKLDQAGPAAKPRLFLTTPQGQVESSLEDIRKAVQEAVRNSKPHVIIKPDARAPIGTIGELTQLINSIEGAEFSLGVRERIGARSP